MRGWPLPPARCAGSVLTPLPQQQLRISMGRFDSPGCTLMWAPASIESYNGRDLKDHVVPALLPWAMLPTTKSTSDHVAQGPAWHWTPPGMGRLQLLWAACASTSPKGKMPSNLCCQSQIFGKLNCSGRKADGVWSLQRSACRPAQFCACYKLPQKVFWMEFF